MPPISAVLFDYGLVLTGPPDPVAWELMKLLFGAEDAPFQAAYWKHRGAYDEGLLTATAYWQKVGLEFGQQVEPEALQGLIEADTRLWTQPNQPMIDWAAKLQEGGMKTGILSNIGDAMELGVFARCPWMHGFTHHTFSHRLGIGKPDLMIYRHAAEGLQTPPDQILFIDDREENIAAARAAGMKAIQYVNHQQFLEELQPGTFEPALLPALPSDSFQAE